MQILLTDWYKDISLHTQLAEKETSCISSYVILRWPKVKLPGRWGWGNLNLGEDSHKALKRSWGYRNAKVLYGDSSAPILKFCAPNCNLTDTGLKLLPGISATQNRPGQTHPSSDTVAPSQGFHHTERSWCRIILVTYDPLSSESNPAEVHCQIDVGMDKRRCGPLTPFRHSNSEFEVIGLGIPSGH